MDEWFNTTESTLVGRSSKFEISMSSINPTVEVEVNSTKQRYCVWGRGLAGAAGRGATPVVAGEGVPASCAGGL
jgi:hypothetical protein